MKKTIFITIGVLIILIVVGVWAYLFTYGAPKNPNEIFTNFGVGREVAPVITPETSVDIGNATKEGVKQKLKQLTTKPVAGAVFITRGIRYVEQGTGHVYDIDLATGKESLVNGTTLPQSADALFAKDGSYVAITSYGATGNKTILEKVGQSEGNTIDGVALPQGAREIYFGDSTSTLMYLLKGADGASGYSYSIKKGTGTQIFKIALRDVHVLWGDRLYVYTTPTLAQEGHLYRVLGSDLTHVTHGGFGLTGLSYDNGLLVTTVTNSGIVTNSLSTGGKTNTLPVPAIPEKCVPHPSKVSVLYCATPTNIAEGVFPDDWYKGVLSYSDILWEINITEGISTVVSNFFSESGREIDVSKIGTNEDGTLIYFINKNDNTLWLFDTTL